MKESLEILKQDIRKWYKGVLVALLALLFLNIVFGQVCPMVLMLGIPCPGCGITRSVFCLFTGHFQEAFYMNPLVYPLFIYVAVFVFYRYILKKEMKSGTICVMMMVLACTLVYVYRMLVWFPNREPMVYYPMNVLAMLREILGLHR